jgi:hypothetical protein
VAFLAQPDPGAGEGQSTAVLADEFQLVLCQAVQVLFGEVASPERFLKHERDTSDAFHNELPNR